MFSLSVYLNQIILTTKKMVAVHSDAVGASLLPVFTQGNHAFRLCQWCPKSLDCFGKETCFYIRNRKVILKNFGKLFKPYKD